MTTHSFLEILQFFPSFLLTIIWNIILFSCGTLLQRNKEVLHYLGIKTMDDTEHLVDKNMTSGFNPSSFITNIGSLLKIYAIIAVIVKIFPFIGNVLRMF